MDGNGRWAEKRGLMRFEGHKAGVKALKETINHCLKTRIPILSLFAFSSENWMRPANEVDALMQLFLELLQQEIIELHEHQIRLYFTGDRHGLSAMIREQMQNAENLTAQNNALILNLALNYGGRWEIALAAKRLAKDVQAGRVDPDGITETIFAHYLMTSSLPEPDLFIRTSGEHRISNFFLWQLAYTELYFTYTLWPDFNNTEFDKALDYFSQRERRFGGIHSQAQTNGNHVDA